MSEPMVDLETANMKIANLQKQLNEDQSRIKKYQEKQKQNEAELITLEKGTLLPVELPVGVAGHSLAVSEAKNLKKQNTKLKGEKAELERDVNNWKEIEPIESFPRFLSKVETIQQEAIIHWCLADKAAPG